VSCQNNANKVASIRCGISKVAGQFANARASIRGGLDRAMQGTDEAGYAMAGYLSPVANATLGAVNAGERLGVSKLAVWGLTKAFPGVERAAALAGRAINLVGTATAPAGSAIGGLSRRELKSSAVQTVRFLEFFKKKTSVQAWTSHLTPLLNSGDLLTPGSRRNITASEGVVISVNGKSWHNGATTVKTPAGERTINHLQSLTVPMQHTYFNRALSDKEVSGIVGRQLNPTALPGFVGQISSAETLSPGWANAKRAMIKARIFGDKTDSAPPRYNLGPLTRLPNPAEVERLAGQARGVAGKVEDFAVREAPETEILFKEGRRMAWAVGEKLPGKKRGE